MGRMPVQQLKDGKKGLPLTLSGLLGMMGDHTRRDAPGFVPLPFSGHSSERQNAHGMTRADISLTQRSRNQEGLKLAFILFFGDYALQLHNHLFFPVPTARFHLSLGQRPRITAKMNKG